MNKKTREMVLAAILTALSILITYSPVKLVLPFFTLTVGSHTPTILAMLVSPWVAVMTVIGSCIGFFMTIPAPNSIIVVMRAATHLLFALVGCKMVQDKKVNIYLIILITAVLHALAEGNCGIRSYSAYRSWPVGYISSSYSTFRNICAPPFRLCHYYTYCHCFGKSKGDSKTFISSKNWEIRLCIKT